MIKIIIGVYGDEINAQNINGLEIARRLDTTSFDTHMFYYHLAPAADNITFHKISSNRVLKNLMKLFYLIFGNYDVYYLPKAEKIDMIFSFLFGKSRCIISSVEIENALHDNKLKKFFCSYVYAFFAINQGLQSSIEKTWGIDVSVLYLGYCKYAYEPQIKRKLQKIVFVGSLIKRKRPEYFLSIAQKHPNIEFIMIGDGPLRKELEDIISNKKINNAVLMGSLPNPKVYEVLSQCDLLLLTSESEGQPKVSLEAGSLGVPTCYIKNTYSIDYIENGVSGFETENLEEVSNIISLLEQKPELLENASTTIAQLTDTYSWDQLVTGYGLYFEETYKTWRLSPKVKKGNQRNLEDCK